MFEGLKVLYINQALNSEDGSRVHAHEFVNSVKLLKANIICYPEPVKDLPKNIAIYQCGGKDWALSFIKSVLGLKIYREIRALLLGIINSLNDANAIRRIIQNDTPSVILMRYHKYNFAILLVNLSRNVPLILEVNAPIYLEHRMHFGSFMSGLAEYIEKKVWLKANAIIVVSEVLKNFLQNDIQLIIPINVVLNGVNLDSFSLSVDGESVRRRYGIGRRLVVGYVGSFFKWHKVDLMIRTLARLVSHGRDVILLLVGEGKDKEEIVSLVNSLGLNKYVVFTGKVSHDQVPEHIHAMDICLCLYGKDIFNYFSPLKVFEYMAMNKAIVGSGVGQISDLMGQGTNGILIDNLSEETLESVLIDLFDDPKKRLLLGKNAGDAVRELSWVANATKVLNLCRDTQGRIA